MFDFPRNCHQFVEKYDSLTLQLREKAKFIISSLNFFFSLGLQREIFSSPNATKYKSMAIYDGQLYIGGKEHLYIQQAGTINHW